ncbi:MAG: DUF2207 domain-containing protein [Dehalococcoidia bacterium]
MGDRIRPAVLGIVLVVAYLVLAGGARAQDTGWTIDRFHADIAIQPDAAMLVTEAIDVDFGSLDQHGIFREIPIRFSYDRDHERVYGFEVLSVTNADGQPWPYEVSRNGANVRIKIGDPDRTVSGRQTYRITYRVEDALNAFETHDELFWNVTGAGWQVPMVQTSATVTLADGLEQAACFQGARGSTDPCQIAQSAGQIDYAATEPLQPGEQLTIVAGIRKGAIAEPTVRLEEKPRDLSRFFETVNPVTIGGTVLVLLGGIGFLAVAWWKRGRDRRYTSIYYLTENPEEETRPLFKDHPVVVEFQPPENLKPAEMGLLLDESADTKDVTATIVDLAVRGYLTITEIPKQGIFGSKDWQIDRKRTDTAVLALYERLVFDGLFHDGDEVKLSSLKNEFYKDLQAAQKALYDDATTKKWFSGNPQTIRNVWVGIGIGVIVLGVGATVALGYFFGAAMIGIPLALIGVVLLISSGAMPRRTARGSELLRRVLGFRQYITTAETDRQRFNEKAGIFAEYLPYAIVFGAVDRWARAFRDIDTTATTASWYAGAAAFNATAFSSNLESFSSSVSSTISSTPGSSGSSGFSGGSAGGGGGGGGGGSW